MSTKAKRSGKMGRPPTGNTAFMIRMKPETHADLLRAAKQDGYQRLPDWFNNMPAELVSKVSSPAWLKNPSLKLLNEAFRAYSAEVTSAFSEMRLLIERNPMLDQHKANRKASGFQEPETRVG
jgi:hypothetical protein